MSRKRPIPSRLVDTPPGGSSWTPEDAGKEKSSDGGASGFLLPSLFSTEKRVWGFYLAFRAFNSLLVRTYFDPDENWRSLEVAHRIVFGYGHLTWEWKRGIRSYAHPPIFVLLYKLLDLLHLDTPWFMGASLCIVMFTGPLDVWFMAGGDHYGTHKWHWYITQGFPTIAFTFLPLTLHGIYKSKEWNVSCLIAWVLVIYSFLGHKEFRFVLPILPLALMFSGYSLAKMVLHSPTHKSQSKPHYLRPRRYSLRLLIVSLLLMTNFPVALYICLIHQRGREDVRAYLAKKAHHGRVKNILFLMPCHSTPYYSTLHYNLPMRFLDCSPSDKIGVLDESDRFKNDPFNFMLGMVANWTLPSHIVIFDHQEVQLRELLHSHSFNDEKRFFNAHFPAGDVLQAFVHVYYRKD